MTANNVLNISEIVLYGLQSKWADLFFKDESISAGKGNLNLYDESKILDNYSTLWGTSYGIEVPMTSGSYLSMGVPGKKVLVRKNEWDKFNPVSISGEEENVQAPSWGAAHAAKNFYKNATSANLNASMFANKGDIPFASIFGNLAPSVVANNQFGMNEVKAKSPFREVWHSTRGLFGLNSRTVVPVANKVPKLEQKLGKFDPYSYYFDLSEFAPENIFYVGGSNGEALKDSMTTGSVRHGQRVRAGGVGASQSEIFIPGSGFDPYQVNYSIRNSITATTVKGTSSTDQQGGSSGGTSTTTSYDLNTTTNSSSKTSSWNVSATVGIETEAKVPLIGESKVSASLTAGGGGSNTNTSVSGTQKGITQAIQTNYSSTWSNVQGVNFSASTGKSSSTGSTVSQTVNLSDIKENSDGTYGYGKYTLIPGDRYEIYVSFAQVDVVNKITGLYGIRGDDIGEIKDSQGNVIDNLSFKSVSKYYDPSLIVHSIRQAQNRAASHIFGAAMTGFGDTSFNGTSVEYEGTAVTATSVGVDGSWSFVKIATAEDALKSSPTSMLSAPSYDLAQAQSHESVGVSLDLRNTPATGSGVVKVAGTGAEDTVYASDHHGHQFAGFSGSFLYGGSKNDEAILSPQDAANSLLMKDGDDTVRAFSGQQADLGSGSDRYEVNGGGTHLVKTGNGYDSVVVNDITGFFQIADFDLTRDQLIFGDSVSADSISMVLSDDVKDADPFSAYFNIYDGENQIGRIFLDHSLETSDFYLDSRLTLGHQILNSKGDDLVDGLTNYFEAYRQGKPSFVFSDYSAISDLSAAPQSIYDVSAMSHDKLTEALHESLIGLGGDIERKKVSAFVGDNRNELTSSQMYGLFLDELMPQAGLNFESFMS